MTHNFLCIVSRVSKGGKLLEKLLAGNQDLASSFTEAEQILMHAGFVVDGGKGSYRVYRHADGRKMVLPYHGKNIKPAYIREIRKLMK